MRQFGVPPAFAMKPKITRSLHGEPATVTVVSNDDPGDFGVVNGVVGYAGSVHTTPPVVGGTVPAPVVDVAGSLVVGPIVVTVAGSRATVVVVGAGVLPPLLLHAASTTAARQTQTTERRTAA